MTIEIKVETNEKSIRKTTYEATDDGVEQTESRLEPNPRTVTQTRDHERVSLVDDGTEIIAENDIYKDTIDSYKEMAQYYRRLKNGADPVEAFRGVQNHMNPYDAEVILMNVNVNDVAGIVETLEDYVDESDDQ